MLELKSIKILKKTKQIFLIFDKNQCATIYPFGLTTFTSTTPLVIKDSLLNIKNDFLSSKFFKVQSAKKEETEILKEKLSIYLNTKFSEYGERD
jgi:hypothetical protein